MAMTFTYDLSTTIGQVRLMIGDTDSTDVLLYNEEISAMLTTFNNAIALTSANCARAIGGKYTRKADKQIGDLKIQYMNRSKAFFDLADNIMLNQRGKTLIPYCGGISQSDKSINEDDSDLVQPSFKRQGMSHGGTGAFPDETGESN